MAPFASGVVRDRPVRYTSVTPGPLKRLGLCRLWRDFRRGGMAEWSMAVVLKTETVDLLNSRLLA